MDKATELTDAYVEVRFADYDVQRTHICRRTLNPVWNEDFRFEVSDDADLQNEPLEVRVLDYDAISANDVVGSVYIDLNSLLSWDAGLISGPPASSTADPNAADLGNLVTQPVELSASLTSNGTDVSSISLHGAATDARMLMTSQPTSAVAPSNERQINGWFPLYDTMCGIRGELNVQVKLQFFGDVNPFKDSSAGVQVFGSTSLPLGYRVEEMFGFVEVLLTEDDPEYHWSDSFRTPRYSNESRQKLLYRLSGNVRRRLGREVLEMGGNAVIGFKQSFDLENKLYTITARATGTCVRLSALPSESTKVAVPAPLSAQPSALGDRSLSHGSVNGQSSNLPPLFPHQETASSNEAISTSAATPIDIPQSRLIINQRRPTVPSTVEEIIGSPSAVDPAEYVPHGSPFNYIELTRNNSTVVSTGQRYRSHNEQYLITLSKFPEGAVASIGGIVSARSVKLLQNDEHEIRDSWWNEIREEIKSHARALNCPVVLGYKETTTINDELCVLSAIGTAAKIDFRAFDMVLGLSYQKRLEDLLMAASNQLRFEDISTSSLKDYISQAASSSVAEYSSNTNPTEEGTARTSGTSSVPVKESNVNLLEKSIKRIIKAKQRAACLACHIPYSRKRAPFPMNFIKCNVCRKNHVPEILLTNIEPLTELETIGEGYYVEAHICRPKKRKEGESNATIVSESLPFIEYDIHRQLLYKLRIQGLNALFGLQVQISIGDSLIVAVASGTATYISALPPPPALRIARNLEVLDAEDRHLLDIQKRIMERSEANRKRIETTRMNKVREMSRGTTLNTIESSIASPDVVNRLQENAIPEDIKEEQQIVESGGSKLDLTKMNPALKHIFDVVNAATNTSSPLASPLLTRPRMGKSRNLTSATTYTTDDPENSDSSDSTIDTGVDTMLPTAKLVVQVDDDTDEDLMAVLLDPQYPEVFQMCNTELLPMQDGLKTPMSQLNNLLTVKTNYCDMLPSLYNAQMITVVKEGRINTVSHHPNRQLAAIFRELYEELQVSLSYLTCCLITGIQYDIQLSDENEMHILLNAMVIGQHMTEKEYVELSQHEKKAQSLDQITKEQSQLSLSRMSARRSLPDFVPFEDVPDDTLVRLQKERAEIEDNNSTKEEYSGVADYSSVYQNRGVFSRISQVFTGKNFVQASAAARETRNSGNTIKQVEGSSEKIQADQELLETSLFSPSGAKPTPTQMTQQTQQTQQTINNGPLAFVEITPLMQVPGSTIVSYLGRLSLHFVKEDLNLHHFHGHHYTESQHHYADAVLDDGLGTFIHKFLMEIQAIVRAHTVALGGNALVAFSIEHSLFQETIKNQAYGMVSVSGDVVEVKYADSPTSDLKSASKTLVTGEEMVNHLWIKNGR